MFIMIRPNDQLPVADAPDIYKSDPYGLPDGSPLLVAEEEVRAQMGIGDQESNTIRKHTHNGVNSKQIGFAMLSGLLKVGSAAPTGVPRSVSEQIVLYSNGGTFRIYFYVTNTAGAGAWRYVALT